MMPCTVADDENVPFCFSNFDVELWKILEQFFTCFVTNPALLIWEIWCTETSPSYYFPCEVNYWSMIIFSNYFLYLFLPKIQPTCSCLQGTHAVAVILPTHILHKWLQSLTKVCFITTICVCLYLLSFIYSSHIMTEIGSMYYSNYVCS